MNNIVSLPKVTICRDCKHFVRKGRGEIWYDLFCGAPAVRRQPAVDYVTGERGFADANDLGRAFVADEPMPHARDINTDGKCPHFDNR